MTTLAACALLVLALLDGAFSGFRSSVGRTGLVNHRGSDRRANLRGVALVSALLVPATTLASVSIAADHDRIDAYTRGGLAMLAIYGPYTTLVLAALLVYALLGWRQRYLAAAVILGPLTLLRPVVAIAGAMAAAEVGRDAGVAVCAVLAVLAVLAGEPLADRLWYDQSRSRSAGSGFESLPAHERGLALPAPLCSAGSPARHAGLGAEPPGTPTVRRAAVRGRGTSGGRRFAVGARAGRPPWNPHGAAGGGSRSGHERGDPRGPHVPAGCGWHGTRAPRCPRVW